MPLTGEEKKAYNKEYNRKLKELKESIEGQSERDIQANGKRYKAECLSYLALQKIYLGQDHRDNGEAEEEIKRSSTKKKITLPKPFDSEILGGKQTFDEWLELRDKARKDLYWLGKTVFKKDFEPNTHQVVCDQFISKNFDSVYHEGYTRGEVQRAINRQFRVDEYGNPTKDMLLLDPRGFFKSTINLLDSLQWMLNCPDIRILFLTGEYSLASSFLGEIKAYFYQPMGATSTDFQLLFPEYILRGVDGTSDSPLECPARIHARKEPTFWVNAIVANLSGWHCDLKKGDDIITDRNSDTEQTREKINRKYNGTRNLLDEWGFSDHIGTRYFPNDWYGLRLKTRATDFPKKRKEVPIKYFCRQCWNVKPEFTDVSLEELEEHMVVLNFPEKATWDSLQEKLSEDKVSFQCQQLNMPVGDSAGNHKPIFTEDILRAHLYGPGAVPAVGDVFVAWDWASTASKTSDLSVGVAARVYQRETDRLFGLAVLEIAYGRWKPSELAQQIVLFNRKIKPKKTLIEASEGAQLLQNEVYRQSQMYQTPMDIFWKPPSLQENAKRNRIKGLEVLLADNRLHFVLGPWTDEMISQMVKYTGERKNKGRKDDIPDAMAYLCTFLPAGSLVAMGDTEEVQRIMQEEKDKQERLAQYQSIFGSQQLDLYRQVQQVQPENPRRSLVNQVFGVRSLRA